MSRNKTDTKLFYRLIGALLIGLFLSVGCTSNSNEIENSLLVTQGRSDEAIQSYRQLIEKDSQNADLYYQLAKVFYAIGDLSAAEKEINRAILIEPLVDHHRLLAGKIALYSHNHFGAINHFKSCLTLNNRFLEAYYLIALAYEQVGKRADALLQLEAAISIEPLYFDAHLAWAQIKFRQVIEPKLANTKTTSSTVVSSTTTKSKLPTEFSLLIFNLKKALKIKPDSIEGNLLLSRIYYSIGSTFKAKMLLESWLKKFGENDQILYALAEIKFRAGLFTEANEIIKQLKVQSLKSKLLSIKCQSRISQDNNLKKEVVQLLKTHPESAELHLLSGEFDLVEGKWIAAERSIQKSLDIDPDYAEAYFYLSKVYQGQNDFIGEDWALKKALELEPGNHRIKIYYLKSLLEEGKWEEVSKRLESYVLDSSNPEVLYIKAVIAKEKGDYFNAGLLFSKAQNRQFSKDIELQMADMEIRQGKIQGAEKRLERIKGLFPENLEVALVQAKLSIKMKQIDKVVPLLTPYVAFPKGKGRIQLVLAEALVQQNKIEQAIKLLERGLKIWPRHVELIQEYTLYLGATGMFGKAIPLLEDMQTFKHKYSRLFYYRLRQYYYQNGQMDKFKRYRQAHPLIN